MWILGLNIKNNLLYYFALSYVSAICMFTIDLLSNCPLSGACVGLE